MHQNIQIKQTTNSKLPSVDFNNLPFGRVFTDHMFICEYKNAKWENPRIVPFDNFSIHPATSALHYGQAIFEGMKAQRSKDGNPILFRPAMNARRFNKSAKRMAMPEIDEQLYLDGVEQLVDLDRDWIPTNEGYSLYIRPFMFATDEYVGIKASDHYTFIIFCSPVGVYYSGLVDVFATDKYVRAFPGGTGFAKAAGNYAAALLPLNEVKEKGYDQILWLDGIKRKMLQEIGTMNIMVQIGDEYITPPTHEGTILKGVTRDSFIQLLKDEGQKVVIRDVSIDELIEASENEELNDAFGMGTAATVSHIAHIGYQDMRIALPDISKRQLSVGLGKKLQAIKRGEVDDIHGWTCHIKANSNNAIERVV